MKQLVKNIVGRSTLTMATWLPENRQLLERVGLRTSQGLFGDRVVAIKFCNGNSFKLAHVDESYLAFELFWHGGDYYEPITRALLSHLIRPAATFVDVGAHLGFFSITSGVARRDLKILAFEPNPKNFRLLRANAAANGLDNVICEQVAISDKDGVGTLYLTESDMSASLMKGFQEQDTKQTGEMRVRTRSLDSYVEEHGIAGPLVIKVDIEGHEPAFFRGASSTIAAYKPDIILEVLYEQEPGLIDELKALGYRFYPVTDQGLTELEAPRLIKRYPFLFLNHLLSTRPRQELAGIFDRVQAEIAGIDLHQTSKHFPKEQWPLLWTA
jgi:FkbM family methyltransferase